MEGLRHRYLVGIGVDPGDPESVVVSAALGPYVAYTPGSAEAHLYRRTSGGPFTPAMQGLPSAQGTIACRIATRAAEPGAFYAANNHGLFRSRDQGQSWTEMEIDWPEGAFQSGVNELIVFEE